MPFDEKGNSEIKLEDISPVLVYDYLRKTGSRLLATFKSDRLNDILEQLDLYTGPTERRLIKNVAAMMFCEEPEKFFPYFQVDVVNFPNGKKTDPGNFSEVTFKGSVPELIKKTMDYLSTSVIR